MKISDINMLTPIEVVIEDGDSKKGLLIFYDNESGSIHSMEPMDEAKKTMVQESIKQYFDNESVDVEFSMPEYVLETMAQAENENHEFFGLTKEMKEQNNQETENKEGEDG